MRASTKRAVEAALGSSIDSADSVSGGDINDAFACSLGDGRRVFVKTNARADPRMFPCEAVGLAWLAEANALRVPEVLAVNDEDAAEAFLVLELMEPARPRATYHAELGRGLAALHRFGGSAHGLDHDNFLATLEQDNTPAPDWPTFYARRRLEPLVRRAIEGGHAPASWRGRFESLFVRLAALAGPGEPPARLHGDLWSGNLHVDQRGGPVLIDPAVYGGHREIDLAMLRLFGSPPRAFFDAYDETYPRSPGHEERVALYQIYPLLAHVNLFGGGYVGAVEAALRRYD